MRYKVGDRVKIKEDLVAGETYGGIALLEGAREYIGKEATVTRVRDTCCWTDIDNSMRAWTEEMLAPVNEMLEPVEEMNMVEEMSAVEAIKLHAELCIKSHACYDCPIYEAKKEVNLECNKFQTKYPEKIIEILKQWKADHEKKPIETEFANIVRVIEDTGDTKKCVYEEEIPYSEDLEEAQVRVLKEYCENHDGKFIAVMENICRVKE